MLHSEVCGVGCLPSSYSLAANESDLACAGRTWVTYVAGAGAIDTCDSSYLSNALQSARNGLL